MKRQLFTLLLLAFVAGCDLGTGEPDVQFTNSLLPSSQGAEESADVQAGAQAVYGAGVILTPNTCQKITAAVRVSGSALTITITAANQRTTCEPGTGAYTYQFAIEDIDPGNYTLKLVYDYSGQKPAVTKVQKDVTIV